jgi:MarR family transcriptional regulator, organic hydroperoxide resistance regulator
MNQHKIESSVLSVPYLISKTELFQKLAVFKFFQENDFSLTYEQLDLLHILYQEDDISQSELGKVALKNKSNVARILSILEEKRFIKRNLATHNNRIVKKVFITDEGRDEIDKMMPIITEVYEKVLKGISEEQIDNLKKTLAILRNNLKNYFNLDI